MWTKLDDGFCEHPKTEALSDAAFRLHVSGLNYCSRHLTDGFVAADKAARLVPRFRKQALAELLASGQWIEVENGYELHDFLLYHPTKAEVDEKRNKEAQRKARQRARGSKNVDRDREGQFVSQGDDPRDNTRDDPGDLQGPSPATRPDPTLPSSINNNSTPVDPPEVVAVRAKAKNVALALGVEQARAKQRAGIGNVLDPVAYGKPIGENTIWPEHGDALMALVETYPDEDVDGLARRFGVPGDDSNKAKFCPICGVMEGADHDQKWCDMVRNGEIKIGETA